MANFETETKTRVKSFRKRISLGPTGKLTDDTDLVAYAQKTVPAGYKAEVDVLINVRLIPV